MSLEQSPHVIYILQDKNLAMPSYLKVDVGMNDAQRHRDLPIAFKGVCADLAEIIMQCPLGTKKQTGMVPLLHPHWGRQHFLKVFFGLLEIEPIMKHVAAE